MKKKLFKTSLALMGSLTLGTALLPFTALAGEDDVSLNNELVQDTNLDIPINESLIGQDDEYYYTIKDNNPLSNTWNETTSYGIEENIAPSNTWSKTTGYSIVKGKRTYLETVTVNKKSYLTISGKVLGMTIKSGSEYSESGKFKKYKQEAKITVRYNVYRKIDNKYVTSKTATANTYYIDYVATK